MLISLSALSEEVYLLGVYNPKHGKTLTAQEYASGERVKVPSDHIKTYAFWFTRKMDFNCFKSPVQKSYSSYNQMYGEKKTKCTVQARGYNKETAFEINDSCNTYRHNDHHWILFCDNYDFKGRSKEEKEYLIGLVQIELDKTLKKPRRY